MDAILGYERSEEDDFYTILGCDERSTVEQIVAEYKVRVLHCHPDKHPGDVQAAERFSRLQTAKCALTDPKERERYDMWRRGGIAMSYQQWRALGDSVHMSMHWGVKKQTEPMLESAPSVDEGTRDNGDLQEEGQSGSSGLSGRDSASQAEWKSSIGWTSAGHAPWERDQASEALMRFRNYQI